MGSIREQMGGMPLAYRRKVISGLGATRTLNPDETGSVVVLDKADGITITLPLVTAGAVPGTFFDFMVSVTASGGSYKIITGVGTELLVGSCINCDTDTSDTPAIWKCLVGSSYISINLNGGTTGGLKGDYFRVTNLNSTTWQVTGVTNATGTVATPFAAS
jgi:hypothetical protein